MDINRINQLIDQLNNKQANRRCLNCNLNLSDLMLLSIKYVDKPFYIFDDKNKYIGTIYTKSLMDLDYEYIKSNPKLHELCEISPANNCVELDKSNANDDIFNLINASILESIEGEIILIDKNSNMKLSIVDFMSFQSLLSLKSATESSKLSKMCHFSNYNIYLNKYEQIVNSQHGEDGIFKHIFEVIGTKSKYAVEFGAWDGVYLSNVRNLIIEQGFSALFIEGDGSKLDDCANNYTDYDNIIIHEAFVGFEGENTLDEIFKKFNLPEDIDILSIDIDGYDYHVWEALKNYKPRVVVIEYNPSIPNEVFYINPRDSSTFKGSSASAMVSLGNKKGYSLVAVTITNCIFVLDEEFEKFNIFDNSLEALRIYDGLSRNYFYQTYDKEILYNSKIAHYIWDGGTPFPSNKFKFEED